jgi:hypothetical protein
MALFPSLATEGVAVAVDRPDEAGIASILADGGADVGDGAGEGGLRDVGPRPDLVVNLVLGDGAGAVLHQKL